MILTAKDIYKDNKFFNNFSDWFRKWTKQSFDPSLIYLGITANARINQGRWIVDCPFCRGAEALWPNELYFLCAGCLNNNSKLALNVIMPKNHEKIEAVLNKRKNPINRNWFPGETIKDLERENKEKGVE